MGFRRSLALLVIGTLAPLLVFSAVAIYQYDRARNAAAEQTLLDASRALVLALDRHFEATITALVVLGSSEHLDAVDLAAFHRQCVRAIEARDDGRAVPIFDRSYRVVAGAGSPSRIGEAGAPGLVAAARGVAEGTLRGPTVEGTPVLTAFSRSRAFGWTASIRVPVAGGVFGQPVRAILGA